MSTDKLADAILAWDNVSGSRGTYDQAAALIRGRFIVIDRNDLPKVEEDDGENVRIGPHGNWFARGLNAESLRRHAYRLLVAADWADANPPLNKAAVESLADGIYSEHGVLGRRTAEQIARRLIADGWGRVSS